MAIGSVRTAAPRAAARMSASGGGLLGSLFGGLSVGGGGGGGGSNAANEVAALQDKAPAWSELAKVLEEQQTAEEKSFRSNLASGRGERACALATRRLFDLPEGQEPRVTLYRDTAAWCPYCEKVWLVLEEKRVPYTVEKVNMNCYGEKPGWFWAMQPSGGIPVAKVDGQVIRESNDIIMAIERGFPEAKALLPPDNPKVSPLLRLERELFSSWFRWLTSAMQDGAQRTNFEAILNDVEMELQASGGPYFLGSDLSLVDCMFAPFLERMAASLPYYKALPIRNTERWPRLEAWFVAMEGRPSYRHIQSDYYTHVHDLPPQVGRCQSVPGAEKYAAAIDGTDGSWSLSALQARDDQEGLQPLGGLGQSSDSARREAAERLLSNADAIVRFAARGLGKPGSPAVSAELSDPNAVPAMGAAPIVDAALRHVAQSLLHGPEATKEGLSEGIEPRTAASALGYLRDRISVPRDMSYPAARQLRAHLNFVIESVGEQQAAKAEVGAEA